MPVSSPIVFDVETSVIPGIEQYADEIAKIPSRLKDPEKIAKWKEEAQAKQALFAALDLDLARIVCLCWCTDGKKLTGGIAKDEKQEAGLIAKFWEAQQNRTKVGFNILDFDLPLIIRRSQYLDVSYPDVSVDRYRHPGVVDLMQILSFNGKVSYRRLDFYCRRFGVTGIEDKVKGGDVPSLVMLGDWDSVKRHCAADVRKEWKLAERLGVIELPQIVDPKDTAF